MTPRLFACTPDESCGLADAPAPRRDLRIVVCMEGDDAPCLLGAYVETDEYAVWYTRTDGTYTWAPDDCVSVVKVEL